MTDRQPTEPGLAGQLARVFGRAAAMRPLFHDDITWTLPASFGKLAGPYVGKAAVGAFNELVAQFYDVDTATVEVLDELAAGPVSAVRLIYRATMLPSGTPYSGEYVLFVRAKDGLIHDVHERLDTLAIWRDRTAMGQGELFE